MVYAYYPNRRGLLNNLDPTPKVEHYYPQLNLINPDFLSLSSKPSLRIDRETPIASIGSCFAREIRNWLIENKFNFVQTAEGAGTGAGSARYDRVYSTFSIRQEFERAFGLFKPQVLYWEVNEDGQKHLLDPHRYTIAWANHEERQKEQAEHQKAVFQAFTTAKVIIITVGQGEVWYDSRDGSVFPVLPPLEVFDPQIHKLKVSTFQENLDNLRTCRELIKAHNPDVHLIITTSPVPLKVTFSGENSIIANNAMKSMLRAVVDEFVKESDFSVNYFPAYELVTQVIPNPFTEDGRHVKPETVHLIMQHFEQNFVGQQDEQSMTIHDLIKLQDQGSWSTILHHLERIQIEPSHTSEYLMYLDLFGKACLLSNLLEEGTHLLLKARQLQQCEPSLNSILSTITRNNLLLASLNDNDHHLRLDIAIELISQDNWIPSMITHFLNRIKNRSPLKAIKTYTELIEKKPGLNKIDEINHWLEETLKELEN